MPYQQHDFEQAMDAMWELLKVSATEQELERLKIAHPCVEELDEYGPNGPVGIGLGRMGGHAIGGGEDDE